MLHADKKPPYGGVYSAAHIITSGEGGERGEATVGERLSWRGEAVGGEVGVSLEEVSTAVEATIDGERRGVGREG